MIDHVDIILQDQLFPAINSDGNRIPGKVCVHYPRGSATILATFFTETPVRLEAVPPDQVSGFTIYSIVNGNLLMVPDRPNCPGTIIPGAGLTML
jgi:hypothetical protein